MQLPIYQVDAFTNKTFGGNPAAVVPLEAWLPDNTLLNIATENNLSETAFFVPTENGFHIRWFTPTVEVDLCGHATLATSWVIFNELDYSQDTIKFESLSGTLEVTKSDDGITLNFPAWDSEKVNPKNEFLLSALGHYPTELYQGKKWVAVYEDDKFIKNLSPDIDAINEIPSQGLVITAKSSVSEHDIVSRYFGPQVGIDEDPVTGSAHCLLIPIWDKKLGKTKLRAYQASHRGGDLLCELRHGRVFMTGHATLYMKGHIYV
ncbi:MAG: PhzF family phenazine biosynthesis protein [Alphaproteobacteria bacterium]|nr:PhzF family phenazine biosynthesis protein [Alphaproteobacteria bacterium]